MYRALLAVVLNACIASASAVPSAAPAPTRLTSETAARITLQPEPQSIKVTTKLPEGQSRRPPPPSTGNESSAGDSGGNPYGTLLVTLVLMAAIALRRSGSGRP